MKKLLALVLLISFFASFALVGCGAKEEAPPPPAKEDAKPAPEATPAPADATATPAPAKDEAKPAAPAPAK